MKQQVPTWLAVIILLAVIAIAGLVAWKKAGEKPIAGFPEQGLPTEQMRQRPGPGGPAGPSAAPMPPGSP